MKKTLVSALTTALVVGAASTTFAAANPFADVPADHWAYDAVAQLVQDGVVNGYAADGTFKGDQQMSRYEMAQIVAKAMAKSEAADNNNKALIDKLAAEFSDELANLGVRVANLENKVDNVKWSGLVRFDWSTMNYEQSGGHRAAGNGEGDNNIKLRLEPSMTINDNWTAHARIDYDIDKDNDSAGRYNDGDKGKLKRIWAEGQYGKFNTKLGKFGTFSDASHGLVMDADVTGAEFTYAPTNTWKIKATAARYNLNDTLGYGTSTDASKYGVYDGDNKTWSNDENATYWAVEVNYNSKKWDAGVGYHSFLNTHTTQKMNDSKSSFHVVDLGLGYKFDKNVKLSADFAWGPSIDSGVRNDVSWSDANSTAYNITLAYKGAEAAVKGSWGAHVSYRQMAPFASVAPTYDFGHRGYWGTESLKGWEVGVDYTFTKNIVANVVYFNGKDTVVKPGQGDKANGLWTRVDFIF